MLHTDFTSLNAHKCILGGRNYCIDLFFEVIVLKSPLGRNGGLLRSPVLPHWILANKIVEGEQVCLCINVNGHFCPKGMLLLAIKLIMSHRHRVWVMEKQMSSPDRANPLHV